MSSEPCKRLLSSFEASSLVSSILQNDMIAATHAILALLRIGLPQEDDAELLCSLAMLLDHFPLEQHDNLRSLARAGMRHLPQSSISSSEFDSEGCTAAV